MKIYKNSIFNKRIKLKDQKILIHQKNKEIESLVTIGIPTYNRETLDRALTSLSKQSFRNFTVIISDNAGEDPRTLEVVNRFSTLLPEIYLIPQKQNIGSINNYAFLLSCANTKYFMWLADDDEISDNYVEELVKLLNKNPDSVSAMGRWYHMYNKDEGIYKKQLKNNSNNTLLRICKFILLEADDAFFYSLYRTENIRNCNFGGYLYPNSNIASNFCYVFLLDLIMQGKVLYSNVATWKCHNYTQKQYGIAISSSKKEKIRTLIRRINVYLLYCYKVLRKDPIYLPIILPVALLGFIVELCKASFKILRDFLLRLNQHS